jgi:hypothetical protein
MPCRSHLPLLHHSNYIWGRAHVMKPLVMQFSPTSYYLIPLLWNILVSTMFSPWAPPSIKFVILFCCSYLKFWTPILWWRVSLSFRITFVRVLGMLSSFFSYYFLGVTLGPILFNILIIYMPNFIIPTLYHRPFPIYYFLFSWKPHFISNYGKSNISYF